ncbi:hypothetical protein EON64_01555 [archaeon]|nr:MAG: hypothetical protein EON64_01555 [archaeon]
MSQKQSVDSLIGLLASKGIPEHLLEPLRSPDSLLTNHQYAEILHIEYLPSFSQESTEQLVHEAMHFKSTMDASIQFEDYVQVGDGDEDYEMLEATGFDTACRERMQQLQVPPVLGRAGQADKGSVIIADSASQPQGGLVEEAAEGSVDMGMDMGMSMDMGMDMGLDVGLGMGMDYSEGLETWDELGDTQCYGDTSSNALISLVVQEDLKDCEGPPSPSAAAPLARRRRRRRKARAYPGKVVDLVVGGAHSVGKQVQRDWRSLGKTVRNMLSK